MNAPQQPPYQGNFGPTTGQHAPQGYGQQPTMQPGAPASKGNAALTGGWVFAGATLLSGAILAYFHRGALNADSSRFFFFLGVLLLLVGLMSVAISFAATAVVGQLKSGRPPQ